MKTKRNIKALWLEVLLNDSFKVSVLRDRRNWEEIPLYTYIPTTASLKRLNRIARVNSGSVNALYICEPIDDNKVKLGWVLFRRDRAVYPPPAHHLNQINGDAARRPDTAGCPQ